MESFYSLLCCIGFTSDSSRGDAVDIVGMLPPEIATMILRNLDGESLVCAGEVSTRWRRLVQADRVLARRRGRQLKARRRRREARVLAAGYHTVREASTGREHTPLHHRNGRFPTARPHNRGVQQLAAPLGVQKAVKRKNGSSLQSAKQRFAAERPVVAAKAAAQPARKAMRL